MVIILTLWTNPLVHWNDHLFTLERCSEMWWSSLLSGHDHMCSEIQLIILALWTCSYMLWDMVFIRPLGALIFSLIYIPQCTKNCWLQSYIVLQLIFFLQHILPPVLFREMVSSFHQSGTVGYCTYASTHVLNIQFSFNI